MAKPRIFVSSTFYDLQSIRASLEIFIKSLGYETVLHERGSVPYRADGKPEEGAYREIENCDILVSIIGARFGSKSGDENTSISQKELRIAHELGKQLFVFVQADIYAEFANYKKNAELAGYEPAHADIRVFAFLDEVLQLSQNNATFPFRTHEEIIELLREQWAGLFQQFLVTQRQKRYDHSLSELLMVSKVLVDLSEVLSNQIESKDLTKELMLSIHPAFSALTKKLNIKHRVYFTSVEELCDLLAAYGFLAQFIIGEYDPFNDGWYAFRRQREGFITQFEVSEEVFDSEFRLKLFRPEEWKESFMRVSKKAFDEYDPFADE
ncbi:MAG: DUF4062 domain-containing protein [Armatimonadota bacterium]